MKILGKGTSTIVVEMSHDELARLVGYSNDYRAKEAFGSGWLDSGKEYSSDERISQINTLIGLPSRTKELSKAMISASEAVNHVIELCKATEFNTVKPRT